MISDQQARILRAEIARARGEAELQHGRRDLAAYLEAGMRQDFLNLVGGQLMTEQLVEVRRQVEEFLTRPPKVLRHPLAPGFGKRHQRALRDRVFRSILAVLDDLEAAA